MTETSLPPEHKPLARMQLLSSPIAPPGHCAVCGTPSRPVVDFGMTIKPYGAVYLCETCLTEAGKTIGMVTAGEFAQVKADSSRSFAEQLKIRESRVITNEQYDALLVAIGSLSDVILFGGLDDITVVAGPDGQEQSSLFRDGGEEPESDSGSSEQDNNSAVGEGSTSVSGSNEHGSSFDF